MRTLMAFALVVVALAGCTDNDASTDEPGCDPETHFLDAGGVCNPHVEARIFVDGLPLNVERYQDVQFSWRLDNGTRGTAAEPVHSMDSRILASMEDMAVGNQTGPDDWGQEVAREEHQNLPGNFTASFMWETEGTVYVKGYMLIDGENRWYDLGTVEVTPVQASGNATTVTISGTPPSLSESTIGITIGDGVNWQNDNNLYGYTISFECNNGVTVDDVTVPAGGSSTTVNFLQLTNCDYTAKTDASGSGFGQGDLSGTINVNKP